MTRKWMTDGKNDYCQSDCGRFVVMKLTRGKETIVDVDVWKKVRMYRWKSEKGGNHWYASRNQLDPITRKTRHVAMHRFIMSAKKGEMVDHKNGDGLDNRRQNLRICTKKQNGRNQAKQQGTASRFKGVAWHSQTKKWQAQIKCNGREIYLGIFASETDAARAYNEAATELFGEFARANVLKPKEDTRQ